MARVRANLAALETLHALQTENRAPSAEERAALARWSGWGAVPAVFDPKAADYARFEPERARLQQLLSADEYAAAQRNTLNAHYTDNAYVQAIWSAVRELGFEQGRVLEPGCGSGNFLAQVSESDHVIGVELDPTTAAIASKLHPHAEVRAESFADTALAENSVDLVVGNVPFGDITLHDRRHNQAGHAIHNHFLLKSLRLTRPGGLVAVITSRYTMDAANPAARREMAELADLVGAVRLPTGAHRRAAGTDVVTDLLILRRRVAERDSEGFAFERSLPAPVEGAGGALRINEYFLAHPEHVLGELRADQGDRGRLELGVAGDRNAGPGLEAALAGIVARARDRALLMTERPDQVPGAPVARTTTSARRPDGYLAIDGEGFTRVEEGTAAPYRPPATQAKELRALLGLRDTAVALLEAEAASIDDSDTLVQLRAELNQRYERYVEAHGPLNRFSQRRTGRVDPVSGEPVVARVRPPQGGFRADPFCNVVYALEHFEAATQSASKATIFHERVISRRTPQLGADTPEDALAICLDTFGGPRLGEIARLLGVDERDARRQLGTLVFDDPDTGRLVAAAEYLSGNVRARLAAASAAVAHDRRFEANVDALTAMQPRDLGPGEIHARLGAAWIRAKYVEQFLSETLDDPTVRVEHPGASLWTVKSAQRGSVAATTTWGTQRYSAIDIAQALLEQRQIRIYDEDADGKRTFNLTETTAAAEKAKQLGDRFSAWVWEDPERAAKLAHTYNQRFNALVPRSYDNAHLSLPGLALSFKPRPHQIAAVARIINEPAVGLFHEVGAGKTAEMVMGAMELRRLGLANKPVVVVPNHMLEQFSREWLQLYPQAKLLAASNEDLDRVHRRLFVAKCATGDWDAIVMTRSAFERIPMSAEAQKTYLQAEVEAIALMLERAKADDARFSLKRLERMRLQAEERLKSKLDGAKDPGVTFEQLGIDYVFVDEAHAYKNLRTSSNIPGMSVDGSQRATDLHMKLDYLRAKRDRVGTLATATPIANSMGEAYTMQRYLRPDLLREAGIADFDQWAATFGETTTSIEVAPDGSGLRMQTRFAKFRNVPELLLQWRVSADIKTGEDLKLPVPPIAARASDGQRVPETVVVTPSAELQWYMMNLAERAERVRARAVDPSKDNLLAISSDGRAAGLDLRLVDRESEAPQKADVAAERIAALYRDNRDKVFSRPDGSDHPVPGALQLVFSDLGTPKPGDWSVYEHLRTLLVAQGVPRDAVRFVHEARNDREKGELFAACREGRVAALIGSTEKMGVGTNVQLRAVALHHLDCPWRPADIAQREGRILRQGNANDEVQILRYVTEGSFDAYLWQTVSRKAQFIGQVMRGRLDVREIEDVGEAALSYNEVKALATGNPLLLEHAEAQAELARLERLERAHYYAQSTLRRTVDSLTDRAAHLERRVAAADAALTRLSPPGAPPPLVIGTRTYTKRADANAELRAVLFSQRRGGRGQLQLGSMAGFAITATLEPALESVVLALRGVPGSETTIAIKDLERASFVARLEHRLADLPGVREADARQLARVAAELERAQAERGAPFRQTSELEAARARLRVLDEQLHAAVAPPPQEKAPELSAPAEADQGDAASSSQPAADDALAARWTALVDAELGAIRTSAAALDERLGRRAAELRSRLAAHQEARPKQNGITSLLGGGDHHPRALHAWTGDLLDLEAAARGVATRRAAVREYLTEPAPGGPTKATQLAARRVAAREPELARELAAAGARRQQDQARSRGAERGAPHQASGWER